MAASGSGNTAQIRGKGIYSTYKNICNVLDPSCPAASGESESEKRLAPATALGDPKQTTESTTNQKHELGPSRAPD